MHTCANAAVCTKKNGDISELNSGIMIKKPDKGSINAIIIAEIITPRNQRKLAHKSFQRNKMNFIILFLLGFSTVMI